MFFVNPNNLCGSRDSHARLNAKNIFLRGGGGIFWQNIANFFSFRLFAALFAALFFLVSCEPPASSLGPRSQVAIFGSLQKATKRLNDAVQNEADAAKKYAKANGGQLPKPTALRLLRRIAVLGHKLESGEPKENWQHAKADVGAAYKTVKNLLIEFTEVAGTAVAAQSAAIQAVQKIVNKVDTFVKNARKVGITQAAIDTAAGTVKTAFATAQGKLKQAAAGKFPVRSGHSSVVWNNAIYVIGGIGAIDPNEVWKSTDRGKTWTQAPIPKEFRGKRFQDSAVVWNNAIYVIGGDDHGGLKFDQVWKHDGRSWTEVATGTKFSARSGHSSVVWEGAIYVIGGEENSRGRQNVHSDEVWKSEDGGKTWEEVTTTGPKFSARQNHSSVVIGTDIYVIGGYITNNSSTPRTRRFDEVWKSADGGKNWEKVGTTGAKLPVISGHSSVVLDGAIYVIGGAAGASGGSSLSNKVWKSEDGGKKWEEVSAKGARFSPPRQNHSSVVIGTDIYVIGGYIHNGNGSEASDFRANDVWKSADGGKTWVQVNP